MALGLTLIAIACVLWVGLGITVAAFTFSMLQNHNTHWVSVVQDLLQRIRSKEPDPRPNPVVPRGVNSAYLREQSIEKQMAAAGMVVPQTPVPPLG